MIENRLTLERALFYLVIFGFAGLLPELLLLEHFGEPTQFIPLGLIVLAVGSTIWFSKSRRGAARKTYLTSMWMTILSGPVGIFLHLRGNYEFEREMDASVAGWPLIVEVMTGATPVLAPGTMTLLGLLGLVYAMSAGANR